MERQEPVAPSSAGLVEKRARLGVLQQAARSGGLFPGDDAVFDRLVAQVLRQINASLADQARESLRQLERHLSSVRIDRRFAEKKLERLSRAVKSARLSEAQRIEMERRSQDILQRIIEGRLVEASKEMSLAMSRLKSFSR